MRGHLNRSLMISPLPRLPDISGNVRAHLRQRKSNNNYRSFPRRRHGRSEGSEVNTKPTSIRSTSTPPSSAPCLIHVDLVRNDEARLARRTYPSIISLSESVRYLFPFSLFLAPSLSFFGICLGGYSSFHGYPHDRADPLVRIALRATTATQDRRAERRPARRTRVQNPL